MAAWTKFESDEVGRYLREVRERERAPLLDRKEAQREWFDAMRNDPKIVGERVGWLLDGNYGRGSYLKARQVLESPRMNRAAALSMMVADAEWMTPAPLAIAAWKKLTPVEKSALAREVEKAIRAEEADIKQQAQSRDPRARRGKKTSEVRKKVSLVRKKAARSKVAKRKQVAISRKIRTLRREGYGPKQAAAIAYSMLGVPRKKSAARRRT